MATQTMSFETKFFIKRWNLRTSSSARERLLKSCLSRLFLRKDLIRFLDEFTNQILFIHQGNRVKMLLFCRKLIIQYPAQVDAAHYRAFQEEYDLEIASDRGIDPVKWIDEELSYIKEVNEIKEGLSPHGFNTKKLDIDIPVAKVIAGASEEVLTMDEILKLFKWSKATLDRRRKDGFPCYKIGKKIYGNKSEVLAWREANDPSFDTGNHLSGFFKELLVFLVSEQKQSSFGLSCLLQGNCRIKEEGLLADVTFQRICF